LIKTNRFKTKIKKQILGSIGFMSVAWIPHVSHHDKDVVYGKQKVFGYF